ncbi:hypothetical protein HYDPIDRAFT_112754 [Hydnomerulius pinastri MD-312]|uniref:Uncharacterized protein n=1 Tax=Hydnomerulius pinastri MD-312 TaxID=994086 RepID=A0A0C9VZD7_9AGAM|nr:hypothetical protein HYDPIDRAFT_112754 [Hydnomerulius pinastri MD-312]
MEQMAGIPPAARGIRRENHVCSVKPCFNLLSPSVPWKMCDTCRAHDRKVRQERRLRDVGELPPLPPRTSQKKSNEIAEKSAGNAAGDGQNDSSADQAADLFASSTAGDEVPHPDGDSPDDIPDRALIFTEPLMPPPIDTGNNLPLNSGTPTFSNPLQSAGPSTQPQPTSSGATPTTTATGRRRARKNANPRIGQTSFAVTPAPSSAPPNTPFVPPGSVGPYIPPNSSYPLPYYMPPLYGMPPYNATQSYGPHSYASAPSTSTVASNSSSQLPPQAQTQTSTPHQQNQHLPHPGPMPPQPGPYGAYPPYPYGPYPYPYMPPSQYMQHHAYSPYPGPYGAPMYGAHYPMPPPPPGAYPPNTQTAPSSTSTSKSRKRKKTDTLGAQTPTPGVSVPPNHFAPMPSYPQAIPPISNGPHSIYGQPSPVPPAHPLVPDANQTQRTSTLATEGLEDHDARQHPTQQNSGDADEVTVATSAQGRQCHMCHRSLGASVSSSICERCRTKLKKHSAKVKQRFKLEPKKSAIRGEVS